MKFGLIGVSLLALVVFSTPGQAQAAVPPLEVAQKRLASARKAAMGQQFDLSITVTAGELKSHAASGVEIGDKRLDLGAGTDSTLPWKVLSVLLTSKDPLIGLRAHLGAFDASQTSIETLDAHFVYIWGDSPSIALSRDLSRIRRVVATSGNETWEFRLSGDLGAGGLPERVHVLRSGEPYASVELARAAETKSD